MDAIEAQSHIRMSHDSTTLTLVNNKNSKLQYQSVTIGEEEIGYFAPLDIGMEKRKKRGWGWG